MIVLISGGCDPGASVRAVTVTRLVIGVPEFVMNAFSPSITHSPARLVEHRPRAGAARVAAGLGLGQAEAAEGPSRAQVGQPLLALLLGAEDVDRVGAEADARLERDRHRLVDPAELLDGHAERGEVAAAAAVLLGEGQAEQAQLAHGQDGVDREGVVAVPGLGVRRDLAAAKSRTTLRNDSCSSLSSKSIEAR